MLRPRETSAISPKREAKRLRLSEDERALLQAMERELARPLTEPEEHLALEQARRSGWSEQTGGTASDRGAQRHDLAGLVRVVVMPPSLTDGRQVESHDVAHPRHAGESRQH